MYSTNNRILKKNHVTLPAIECVQRNTSKVAITEEEIKKTNKNGMGNKVGVITNYVTSMLEVQSRFKKNSKEYKELNYRIGCGQLFQQDELDKIKGIVSKPMPSSWYSIRACSTEFEKDICANKKPYFMIYIYDTVRKEYKNYEKIADEKCLIVYGCTIQELYNKEEKAPDEIEFLKWYEAKMPVGIGPCTMNRICWYVESQLDGYKAELKKQSEFDYTKLKVKRRCTEEHRKQLLELEHYYKDCVKQYKVNHIKNEVFESFYKRVYMIDYFDQKAKEICPNDDERMNIILDITYTKNGNNQFCWDCVGDLLLKRLEDLKNE